MQRAAKALDIEINILEARAGTLEQTVRSAADRKPSALVLLGSPVLSAQFRKIAEATLADQVADYCSPSCVCPGRRPHGLRPRRRVVSPMSPD